MTIAELDVFKDIVSSDEIDSQVLATLNTWMDTYLAEIQRQRSLAPIPSIRSYVTVQDFRHEPENQMPAIVVVNPGTNGNPVKDGEGWYSAKFVIAISAIVSTATQPNSLKVSKIYGAAVRAVMTQKKAGGNMVSDVKWLGESNDTVDRDSGDMIAASTQAFELICASLVKERGTGPAVPSTVPPVDMPTVQPNSATATVIPKEDS